MDPRGSLHGWDGDGVFRTALYLPFISIYGPHWGLTPSSWRPHTESYIKTSRHIHLYGTQITLQCSQPNASVFGHCPDPQNPGSHLWISQPAHTRSKQQEEGICQEGDTKYKQRKNGRASTRLSQRIRSPDIEKGIIRHEPESRPQKWKTRNERGKSVGIAIAVSTFTCHRGQHPWHPWSSGERPTADTSPEPPAGYGWPRRRRWR